jgi:uncharacterized membrane protein YjfL (UPF0719 family)
MSDLINLHYVINALVFSFMGVGVFTLSFLVLDWITPYNLWKELIESRNQALATVVAAASLGICIIVAASIHG